LPRRFCLFAGLFGVDGPSDDGGFEEFDEFLPSCSSNFASLARSEAISAC
jgi:hypothetical protein